MTCTFFGHRTVTKGIEPILQTTLIDLIETHHVNLFYVGNTGAFDTLVHRVLKKLEKVYHIEYYVVLAYLPKTSDKTTDMSDTLFPEGIETVPPRFAIVYRNKWMLRQSEYVVTYVTSHIASRASQFKVLAEKQGKTVINLA